MRGFDCSIKRSELTGRNLVFWKSSRLEEEVVHLGTDT